MEESSGGKSRLYQPVKRPHVLLWLLGALLVSSPATTEASDGPNELDVDAYSAEMAVSWNERVIEIAVAEDGLMTLKGVRTLAMLHVAMHDALNAIHSAYAI